MNLQNDASEAVSRLRLADTDLQDVEVKAAAGGLPKSVPETISAFANGQGGLLLLGLAEESGFQRVEIDAAALAAGIAGVCADRLDPPVRPTIDIVDIDGGPVVAVRVEELSSAQKPCFVKDRGLDRGSFLRTHDGDRALTSYEVHILMAGRGQPHDDLAPVAHAGPEDLDPNLVAALLRRLRSIRPVFERVSDTEALTMVGVYVRQGDQHLVTVGGLLALGKYPQQFYPQLDITFVSYPTSTGQALADGTRFLDNQSIDGPIPALVSAALAVIRRNLQKRSVIAGLGREDHWEYPLEAIREVVANAVIHRDYHPLSHGTQVRIELFPDRLEISSPGGLHGSIAQEDLMAESVSSSRNAHLSKLLEDVEIAGTGRTVCENRGSGLLATAAALRDAGIEPPEVKTNFREFRMIIRNHGLLDKDALDWLATVDNSKLNDHQRLALVYVLRHGKITNPLYRTLTGVDALTATRELSAMGSRSLLTKTSDRRWTVWVLNEQPEEVRQEEFDFSLGMKLAESPANPGRRDRRSEVLDLLSTGPKSTAELAEALGISRQTVLNWLEKLTADGVVANTAERRRSPASKWQIVARD